MKIRVLFWLFFCISYLASAQKEGAIWYFGEKAGLDFNSGSPVAITDGEITTNEGCAVISDPNGKLLFYTDGITVYNGQHKVMLNGGGLKGHFSSTNSGIIIPQPGSSHIYYIFTTDAEFGVNGLRYSKVDMSLDGGLGGITATKNVLLDTPVTEKLTAVEIPGEKAFWVVGHKGHSDEFLAYRISESGLDETPVISSVGTVVTLPPVNAQGQMKISPNGRRLALGIRGTGFELYDFDSRTGKVSNYQKIVADNGAYGVEFSPNSKLLYTGSNRQGLIQYDLNAGSLSEIIRSRVTLVRQNWMVWALQLAIDGKIYMASSETQTTGAAYIDVINEPNVRGAGSNYQREALHLNGTTAKLGLPPFIQSIFRTRHIVTEYSCAGSSSTFSLVETGTLSNVEWDFGDGNTSSDKNPTHTYAAGGEYVVNATWISEGVTDSETIRISIEEKPEAKKIDDIYICSVEGSHTFDLTSLNADIAGSQAGTELEIAYFSSEADAEGNINPLPNSIALTTGEKPVYARVQTKGNSTCYNISSFKLFVQEKPVVNPVADWSVCDSSGSYIFDLTQKNSEVLGGQEGTRYSAFYFRSLQEAAENRNAVTQIAVAAEDGEVLIYFRLQGEDDSCSSTGSFNLQVTEAFKNSASPVTLVACDEGGGFGTFETSQWAENILQGQSGYKVNFFTEDRKSLPQPLPSTYRNKTANSERIIAQIISESNPDCVSETNLELSVNLKEELFLEKTYYLCDTEGELELNVPGNFDSWEWRFEDGTIVSRTSGAALSQEGIYSLTVSDALKGVSCAATYTFELIVASSPKITNVKYGDRMGEKYIEIIATGENLEFSIDGINFQDQNLFTGISGGRYGVFVRDKTGCGVATDEVVFLDFPRYFTPNNDGYNDHWQIGPFPGLPETPLYIFDRYGKLLKQLSTKDKGWDGTFNGRPMPSDDYWFSVDIEDKKIRSHFTLMR